MEHLMEAICAAAFTSAVLLIVLNTLVQVGRVLP